MRAHRRTTASKPLRNPLFPSHPDDVRPSQSLPLRTFAQPARCERLRVGERRPAVAARRHPPHALIFVQEIGRPDLRGTRTPSEAASGGVFVFAFARDFHAHARESSRRGRFRSRVLHRHSAASSANARTARSARVVAERNSATRRASAASRCSMRAAAGNAWAHGLPVGDGRQCGASIERSPAARVSRPSGARGAAVAYADDRQTVFRQDGVSSARESSGSAAGRRFDSGTPTTG